MYDLFSQRDGDKSMNYTLIDLPTLETQSIISEFERLCIQKELLDLPYFQANKEVYTLYAIIDGALDSEIDQNIEIYAPMHRRLYPEAYSKAAGYAQPFLVQVGTAEEFDTWFTQKGYGNSRALYLLSPLDIDTLTENIAGFSLGQMQEGETFFRFYDPKIFPAFLQMLTLSQTQQVFEEETLWLCENALEPHRLDIYSYAIRKKHIIKHSHDLREINTPLYDMWAKKHPSIKDKEDHADGKNLYFSPSDIHLVTQYKEALFAKRVCLSLMAQVPKLKDVTDFKSIYDNVLQLIDQGMREFSLQEEETLYLWVLAHTLHKDIAVLLREDKSYKEIFAPQSEANQSYKTMMLEEIIERLEEKLTPREVENV